MRASVVVAGVVGLLNLLSRFDSSSPLLPQERACILLPDMVHISQNAILQKKRRTMIMRKPCVSWAEPAQRLQAQKLICSRGAHLQTHAQFSRGCWSRSCSAAYAHLVGARTHSSAEELIFKLHGPPVLADELIFKRHGPPVLADDRRYVIMFYIFSALSRCLKTSPSTSNHKEYARLHGPHSQCGEF